MEKKNNIAVEALTRHANEIYSNLKKDTIAEVKKLQAMTKLSDTEMRTILGLSDKEFSALMDERLYYVIKIDTLIKLKILVNKKIVSLRETNDCYRNFDINEFITRYKRAEIEDSINRLLNTIGVTSAEEIDAFTDMLTEMMKQSKVGKISDIKNTYNG